MSSSLPDLYINAELGIFWDMAQCKIPNGSNASEVLEKVKRSITDLCHQGHVSISTYGDMTDVHFPSDARVKQNHFLAGERYARETKMLEDIVAWASENPLPSSLMIISGDVSEELVEVVLLLKNQKNYNLLFVHPPPPPTIVVLIPPSTSRAN